MIFRETKLAGAFVIDLEPHPDDRGFFARCFCERELADHGLPTKFPQCNLSRNRAAGTLRGMHFRAGPHRESKLVRCVAGAIHDVIVDLRAGSPTYLSSFDVDLTAENGTGLFIPEGFAHGFLTLNDHTDVFYHMGDFFLPEGARGARWNDPAFGISWPFSPRVIAERDASYPDFDPASPDA